MKLPNTEPAMAKWRWTYTRHGEVLHRIARIDVKHCYEPPDDEDDYEWYAGIQGEAVCGQPLIDVPGCPGLLSRMGAKRCDRCCDRLGIKRGHGIPLNDSIDEPEEIPTSAT